MSSIREVLDLAIIGGGPAALSAALYASRAGIKTTVFERAAFGGTLSQIDKIENYPGFIGTGAELADVMRRQAETVGARIEYGECTNVQHHSDGLKLKNEKPVFEMQIDGAPRFARAIIAATGSQPRALELSLNVPISYCALCDGSFAREQRVAVVGGGNSAFQESLYLAELVQSLTLITHSAIKADAQLVERLSQYSNVEIREHLEPTVEILNQFDRIFVSIGRIPATSMFRKLDRELQAKLLDSADYLIAPNNQTALAGLFAAGDVRAGALHQAVVASADGASAALAAKSYLQSLKS